MVIRRSRDFFTVISDVEGSDYGMYYSRLTLVRPESAISCSTTSSNTSYAKLFTFFYIAGKSWSTSARRRFASYWEKLVASRTSFSKLRREVLIMVRIRSFSRSTRFIFVIESILLSSMRRLFESTVSSKASNRDFKFSNLVF